MKLKLDLKKEFDVLHWIRNVHRDQMYWSSTTEMWICSSNGIVAAEYDRSIERHIEILLQKRYICRYRSSEPFKMWQIAYALGIVTPIQFGITWTGQVALAEERGYLKEFYK